MSGSTLCTVQSIASAGAGSLLTLIATFVWGNKADREKIKQEKYRNCLDSLSKHDERFLDYTTVVGAYCRDRIANLDIFQRMSVSGDRFFSNLNLMAAAVMSGSLEDKFSKTTVIPKILDNYGNIEEHYRMLSLIASDIGQSYPSSFNRQNYQAIFDVVDRFG